MIYSCLAVALTLHCFQTASNIGIRECDFYVINAAEIMCRVCVANDD